MNPAEQQRHTTKTDTLAGRLDILEPVVDSVGLFLAEWTPKVSAQLAAVEARAAAADAVLTALRAELTAAQARIARLEAPPATTIGAGLRWLMAGSR